MLYFVFLSRFELIRAGFATAKGDLRLGWISKTKTVITNGKFLGSLPRRLITLQLPKQIVLTLCFNQVLLFLPKRSAKYVIATVPKQLVLNNFFCFWNTAMFLWLCSRSTHAMNFNQYKFVQFIHSFLGLKFCLQLYVRN